MPGPPTPPALPPNVQTGVDLARQTDPTLAPVSMYGWLSSHVPLLSGAQGYTSPDQTIYLNPAQTATMSPDDVAETVMHEQAHVKQMRSRGSHPALEFLRDLAGDKTPYGQRPDEMDAFQQEDNYKRGVEGSDIGAVKPSFDTPGAFTQAEDVHLHPESPSPAIQGLKRAATALGR